MSCGNLCYPSSQNKNGRGVQRHDMTKISPALNSERNLETRVPPSANTWHSCERGTIEMTYLALVEPRFHARDTSGTAAEGIPHISESDSTDFEPRRYPSDCLLLVHRRLQPSPWALSPLVGPPFAPITLSGLMLQCWGGFPSNTPPRVSRHVRSLAIWGWVSECDDSDLILRESKCRCPSV